MRITIPARTIVVLLLANLALASSAVAQPFSPPDGITVVGQGMASAPADSTLFRIGLSSGMFPGEPGWQPVASPAAGDAGPVQPVIDALSAAGVPESDMTVVLAPYIGNGMYGPYGPISAFVEFTVDAPDVARIHEIIDAANAGAAESMMMLGDISVIHILTDCSALQEEAAANAFADAQQRATRQAGILDVALGEVTASRDASYVVTPYDPTLGLAPEGSCAYSPATATSFGPTGPAPYDLASEPEVVVTASMEVTFAIGSGTPATPAS
jgi:uncharacterized protein YggE